MKNEQNPGGKKEALERPLNPTSPDDLKETETVFRIKDAIGQIAQAETLGIFNRGGERIFVGNRDQLLIFLSNRDYGRAEDVGSISGADGKSIMKFGPGDDHGFLNRSRVAGILEGLTGAIGKASKEVGAKKEAEAILKSIPGSSRSSSSPEVKENQELDVDAALALLGQFIEGRKKVIESEGVKQGLDAIYANLSKSRDQKEIATALFQYVYNKKRTADYPPNPKYDEAWSLATEDKGLSSKQENGWVYRGIFKEGGLKTETRGSLNINVTPEAVADIDDLIKRGVIVANYKFGEPTTPSQASDRHDAISIYFLKEPTEEGLRALEAVARKHLRGNELLGRKIGEGFSMSEIGSVSDKQAAEFVERVAAFDKGLSEAVKNYVTVKGGKRMAMSEGQFYAMQDTLASFGLEMSYDKANGVQVKRRGKN